MIQSATDTRTEMIISEEYFIELTRTARGIIAEVKDEYSPFNGIYALGSDEGCAIAALKAKIKEQS
jgi:hypothetical protein